MYTIENEHLVVKVAAAGAELQSIVNKATGNEYMWSGDAKFWGKHSPVLFPVIGTLKDNSYRYKENTYNLGRHGFAREMLFEAIVHNAESISFSIRSNENTLMVFPFPFNFTIQYELMGNELAVTYMITNTGADEMYFSVGGHPAFKVPVEDGLSYNDYYLEFNKQENTGRWPISKEGLIEIESIPLLQNTTVLPLTKQLFESDAIVLKNIQSDKVLLKSKKTNTGIGFTFKGFPYLGIWAAKNADFVCIEPWCGIADSVNSNYDFTKKEGVVKLPASETFERTWSVAIF